jgi:P27 family predicted phage terminase small subunit
MPLWIPYAVCWRNHGPPLSDVPEPPHELSPQALEVWIRLAPDLHAQGVLTAWDVDVFASYCDVTARLSAARLTLDAGLLTRGRRDAVVTNPAFRIYRDLIDRQRALAQEFGLTPSARSRLSSGDGTSLEQIA